MHLALYILAYAVFAVLCFTYFIRNGFEYPEDSFILPWPWLMLACIFWIVCATGIVLMMGWNLLKDIIADMRGDDDSYM